MGVAESKTEDFETSSVALLSRAIAVSGSAAPVSRLGMLFSSTVKVPTGFALSWWIPSPAPISPPAKRAVRIAELTKHDCAPACRMEPLVAGLEASGKMRAGDGVRSIAALQGTAVQRGLRRNRHHSQTPRRPGATQLP